MAKKLYEESNIRAIAEAIRAKNGTTTKYTTAQMAAAITAIETGEDTKTTATIRIVGPYSTLYSYGGVQSVGEIVPANGEYYDELVEVDKARTFYVGAQDVNASYAEYCHIVFNGEVVKSGGGNYTFPLADYDIVTVTFSQEHNNAYYNCAIVAM